MLKFYQRKQRRNCFAEVEPLLVSADLLPYVETREKTAANISSDGSNPGEIPTSARSGDSSCAMNLNDLHMMAATNAGQVRDCNTCFLTRGSLPPSDDPSATKDGNTSSNQKSAFLQQEVIFNSFIQNPVGQLGGDVLSASARKEDSTSFDPAAPIERNTPQIFLQYEATNGCNGDKEKRQESIRMQTLSKDISMVPVTPCKDIIIKDKRRIYEDSPKVIDGAPNRTSHFLQQRIEVPNEPRDGQEKNNTKRQKRRRKKFRAKVVRDESPSKRFNTPKKATSKSVSTRKNKSGERKRNIALQKENLGSLDTPLQRINETRDNSCKVEFSDRRQTATGRKLVKRRLDFEYEGALANQCLDHTSPRCQSTMPFKQMLDEYRNLTIYSSSSSQLSRREILKQNWKKLTREAGNKKRENDLNAHDTHSIERGENRRAQTWRDRRNVTTEQDSHVFYPMDELTASDNEKYSEFDMTKRATRKRSELIFRNRKLASAVFNIGNQPKTCISELLVKYLQIKKRKRSVRSQRNVRQTAILTYQHERNSQVQNTLVQHSNFQESLYTNLIPQAIVPCINQGDDLNVTTELQKVLVPHSRNLMVPFTSHADEMKKQPKPKVDLDKETIILWKYLMENIGSDEVESGIDRERWWQKERELFHGRTTKFIACMHEIQGDRRFSEWKGSVIDSVVGVFLTQNVSDYLSSSAFMELASRFPIESKCNVVEPHVESTVCMENPKPKKQSMTKSQIIQCEEAQQGSRGMAQAQQYEPNLTSTNTNDRLDSEVINEDMTTTVDELLDPQIHHPEINTSKRKRRKVGSKTTETDWDNLRKEACKNSDRPSRCSKRMDTVDWEAVRCADVKVISDTIQPRGMNNLLASRIQDFLNRVVRDHGSLDLEWLRDVPPHDVKNYLKSIKGLGLKSVECVRLLTLYQHAFPVDTNVGRICVRLGWVPIHPLPDTIAFNLLEWYPALEHIQMYLWPRLCKLDQQTLYELHYQMITFGKVFCTKRKPNCNACPMKGDCKHFASAVACSRPALLAAEEKSSVNARLALSIAEENSSVNATIHMTTEIDHILPLPLHQFEGSNIPIQVTNSSEYIVELPSTPEAESKQVLNCDIEDFFAEKSDEIQMTIFNVEESKRNPQNYMVENMIIDDNDIKKALVTITPEAASIPVPKLKLSHRLRTEHQAYELPDSHPLLEGLDQREPDDPSPYLLLICAPDGIVESAETPEACCNFQANELCKLKACSTCSLTPEETIKGTLLIPCRTAMRGAFPLNGTYFQVNEVFADHHSSYNPISFPRKWIWNLRRCMVYMGANTTSIFTGLLLDDIKKFFCEGFICLRAFDRKVRAPRPLAHRLHMAAVLAKRLAKEDKAKKEKMEKEEVKNGKGKKQKM